MVQRMICDPTKCMVRRVITKLLPLLLILLLGLRATTAQALQENDSKSAQLDKCAADLVAADTANATRDGYLTLSKYERFVNERYYADCEKGIVVAESASQWKAFTELACFSCLQDFVFVDQLPGCCLPFNNSIIKIATIGTTLPEQDNTDWLERICSTADEAAVVDECYTFPPTLSPSLSSNATANNNAPNPTTPSMVVGYTSCDTDLIAADLQDGATDGSLTYAEFRAFLERLPKTDNCGVTDNAAIVDAAYATLACASCLATAAAATTSTTAQGSSTTTAAAAVDLSCCTAGKNATRISIDGANVTAASRTTQQTAWITRICTTAAAAIECHNNTSIVEVVNSTTAIPIPSNNGNSSAPTLAPVLAPNTVVAVSNVSQAPTVAPSSNSSSNNNNNTTIEADSNSTATTAPTVAPVAAADNASTPAIVAAPMNPSAPSEQPAPPPTSNAPPPPRQRTRRMTIMGLLACLYLA